MRTIRGRLTAWYSIALLATVVAFGALVYAELGRPSGRDLEQRVGLEADLAQRWLQESYRVLGTLVVPGDGPALDPGVASYFEAFRDYLIVADRNGQVLFLSTPARGLSFADLERLLAQLPPRGTAPGGGTVVLSDSIGPVRVLVRPLDRAGPGIAALLVATPERAAATDVSVVLRAMLLIGPVVLLVSIGLGYVLAGAALRPLESMNDEVDAIADGRSLHRRLAVPRSGDELARLAHTLNGMLARLEQSFASLRRFTADAGHELKTPLMVLRASVERSLRHPRIPPDVMQPLDEALEQVNSMNEMVESLLTLARADEGRAPLAVQRTDLRELMAEAGETAGLLGEEAELVVRTTMPDAPVLLDVDPHRIREMLLNLVTNAVKFTPAGGSVELGLADEGHQVVLTVRDTGIGIAAGDLPHLFERFWRADPARSRTGERPGTGLGLAITKWIAEAHGGTIGVQSRPNRGTTFTVTLPRLGVEPPEAPDDEG